MKSATYWITIDEVMNESLCYSSSGQDERVMTIIKNTCGTSRKLVAEGAAGQPRIKVRGRFA